jgi:hypothetical protein
LLLIKGKKEEWFMENELRKLNIIYKMKREKEVSETSVELPISQKRYEELAKCIDNNNKAWQSIYQTLLQLTYLQGYNELGAWSVELEIRED